MLNLSYLSHFTKNKQKKNQFTFLSMDKYNAGTRSY